MDFKALSVGHKVLLGSTILAVISLFFNWAKMGILGAQNGFENSAFFLLILFIYPTIRAIKGKFVNKIIGFILGGLGLLATLIYYSSYSFNFFGTQGNLSSTGLYLFLFASLGLLVGTFIQSKPQVYQANEHTIRTEKSPNIHEEGTQVIVDATIEETKKD